MQPGTPLARGEGKRGTVCARCVSGSWLVGPCWLLLSRAFTHLAERHITLPNPCRGGKHQLASQSAHHFAGGANGKRTLWARDRQTWLMYLLRLPRAFTEGIGATARRREA